LTAIKQAGYKAVCIEGDGDLADIIYLTCLEAGMEVKATVDRAYPVFRIEEWQTVLDWPEENPSRPKKTESIST
jgi:hypothetical protein